MSVGILYHAFVCFVSGITGLIVFRLLRKIREERRIKYSEGVDYFSLMLGLLWVSVGIRILFLWLGNIEFEILTYKLLAGPLGYLHLIPGFFYLGWSFFKDNKRIRFLFNSFFTIVALTAVFTLLRYGFSRPEPTYWGNNMVPNSLSNKIFVFGVFIPLFPCLIIDFIRRLSRWKKTNDIAERQLFLFTLGLLLYSIIGVFDVMGAAQNWTVLLTRSGMMIIPLIFYLAAVFETED